MQILYWILSATFVNGLLGLIGIIALAINKKLLNKIVFGLVAFSAGTLLGGAFFHLLEESLETLKSIQAMIFLIIGFVSFYILEKLLFWHHCHEGKCSVHPFSYMILIGDGLHNIIDGIVIAASFFIDINFGILTTFIIMSHELPQELGNFGILVYGGFSRIKAIIYSFVAQLTSILGGLIGYYIGTSADTSFLLPIAAGGFIYISASDLIPELHKENNKTKSILSFILFIFGLILMLSAKYFFE